MPNQIIPLTPDEEAHLQAYRAQERAATLEIQPPLEVDPILIAMSSQETAIPSTSSSLGLSLTSTPSSLRHPALSFSAQVPLGYPAARGASTPSSTVTAASPFGPATLPTERLAQRCAIKWNRSLRESGNEDSGADSGVDSGADGGADGGVDGGVAAVVTIDLVLEDLVKTHEALPNPQSKFIISEASGSRVENLTHLLAERDAFASKLLGAVKTMATELKELQARVGEGDVQVISRVRRGTGNRKKLKVERTPLEQQLNDLVKVRTSS